MDVHIIIGDRSNYDGFNTCDVVNLFRSRTVHIFVYQERNNSLDPC